MRVLGIDTSCDETSAAVVEVREDGRGRILSNVVSSQIRLHARFGGVVPEIASRAHISRIALVVRRALREAKISERRLDGVAVTAGPGLAGALLVGVNFAKGLAWRLGLPLVPVHHIHGHLESVFLAEPDVPLPSLALVVSGGHTALYLAERGEDGRAFSCVGKTRDDAVGEAFDKAAKLLGLGYPGGPAIEKLARSGNPESLALPRHPKIGRDVNYDFSLSGLKSALARHVESRLSSGSVPPGDAAASFQAAAVDMLLWTARRAARRFRPASLCMSGGVSANRFLRARLAALGSELGVSVHVPPMALTTDNGAMIAFRGALRFRDALSPARLLALNAFPDWPV
jgi:N6-L-threonylcarbamoyladenine synthase